MFRKRKRIDRSNDERIKNLEDINLIYFSVGIYGDGISPSELSRHIQQAINDMADLINENKAVEASHRWDDDFPCKKIYRNLCSYCGHEFNAVNSENYCPNCGRGMVD